MVSSRVGAEGGIALAQGLLAGAATSVGVGVVCVRMGHTLCLLSRHNSAAGSHPEIPSGKRQPPHTRFWYPGSLCLQLGAWCGSICMTIPSPLS